MSIMSFIDSAIKLNEHEFYDTSLCLVCMALDRCAKDKYPDLPVGNLKPDRDGYVGMEDIIYHIIRCGLAHDCEVDKSISFTEKTVIGDWDENCFQVPKVLIWGLIDAVNVNMI